MIPRAAAPSPRTSGSSQGQRCTRYVHQAHTCLYPVFHVQLIPVPLSITMYAGEDPEKTAEWPIAIQYCYNGVCSRDQGL